MDDATIALMFEAIESGNFDEQKLKELAPLMMPGESHRLGNLYGDWMFRRYADRVVCMRMR